MGHLNDGSRGSWVTKCDPLSALPRTFIPCYRHGRPQAWAKGGGGTCPHGKVVKWFSALAMTVKRLVDELFMHYFWKPSSASGGFGFAPRAPSGLHLWTLLGDGSPRPLICQPLAKICWRPRFNVRNNLLTLKVEKLVKWREKMLLAFANSHDLTGAFSLLSTCDMFVRGLAQILFQ